MKSEKIPKSMFTKFMHRCNKTFGSIHVIRQLLEM